VLLGDRGNGLELLKLAVASKIQSWWDTNKGRFQAGVRHLVGKPITVEHCQHVLASGYQRQRIAAALELSLIQPGGALFEVRAPGWRQQRLLKV
jgi:hypothetical protein